MTPAPAVVHAFTFLLAFCSLFYEFAYAQVLSVCIGGTKTQYLTIIALFTFALGMGTLVFGRVKERISIRKTFFGIELALMVLGSTGPFFLTWLLQPGGAPAFFTVKIYLSYFFVFLIGFFSGFEIPCLFTFAQNAKGKILAMDYLGMLAASVLFPLFFLPELGVGPATLTIAACNGYALVWLRSDRPRVATTIFLSVLVTAIIVSILLYRVELNAILSDLYLMRGNA